MSECVPIGQLPHMSEAVPELPGKTRDFWRGTLLARWSRRMGATAVNYVLPSWAASLIGAPIFGGDRWLGSDAWWLLSFALAMFASGVNPWRFDLGRTLTGTTPVRPVIDAAGRPGFARVGFVWRIVRFLCHPLDFIAGLPVGVVMIWARKDHRCIADLIAGTIVIATPMHNLDPAAIGHPERFPGTYRRDTAKAASCS